MNAKLIYALGRVPFLRAALRAAARFYPEGSVTTIRSGRAEGFKWRRYHRYVSGYYLGIYEPAVQDALASLVREGHVFYDIGANAGFFSLLAARRVGPSGRVYAFEPLPANADVVAEQVALNALANVDLVRLAAGGRSGRAALTLSRSTSTPALSEFARHAESPSIDVEVVRLDDFARGHSPPNVVKMDVEGAEADVLEGMPEVIERHRPAFLIEIHHEPAARRCWEILVAAGYALRDLAGEAVGLEALAPLLPKAPRHVLAIPSGRRTA